MYTKKILITFTLKLAFFLAFFSIPAFGASSSETDTPNTSSTPPITAKFQLPCVPILFTNNAKTIPVYDSNNNLIYMVELYGYKGSCAWDDVSEEEQAKQEKLNKKLANKTKDAKTKATTTANTPQESIVIQPIILELKQNFKFKVKVTVYKRVPRLVNLNIPIVYEFSGNNYAGKQGKTQLSITIPANIESYEKIYLTPSLSIKDRFSAAIYGSLLITGKIDLNESQKESYNKYAISMQNKHNDILEKREQLANKIWKDKSDSGFIEE